MFAENIACRVLLMAGLFSLFIWTGFQHLMQTARIVYVEQDMGVTDGNDCFLVQIEEVSHNGKGWKRLNGS